MALTIDLGQGTIHLSHSNSDLSLMLRASLEISLAGNLDSGYPEDPKELINSGLIWIVQSPEIKMHVVATSRAHFPESVPCFVSPVGDVICKSKLWSDLDLAVLPRSCASFPRLDNSTTLKLSFGLRRKAGRPSTNRIWRVPISAQHDWDAAPPANIHTVYLSTINVFLELYDANQARQEYSTLAPNLPISIPFIVKPKQWSTTKSLQGFPKPPLTQTDSVDEFMDRSSLVLLEELENMEDEHRQEEDRNSQMHHEVDQLLRKGLRSLIVERRRRGDTGTQSSGERDLQPLSRLVPSVFSLGYREAMNQRSHLIPSIAKSLASVLKTTRNPALRSRINDLQALHNPQTEVMSQVTGSTDFRAAIQTALWKIAQKQLYDPGASRKLSVSDAVTTSADDYRGAEEDLLSEVGMADFHDDLNSKNHEIYDSDCYLGSDSEFMEEDETNSVLSFNGNYSHHSMDMLGHTDTDTELDRIWEDETILGHNQNRTTISVLDLSEQLSCQLSISDGEMLASDCFEDEATNPQILPYSPSFPGTPEASDEDCDLMLCDHNWVL